MIKKILIYFFFIYNHNFSANIAKKFLDDKKFKDDFIKKYGNIYNLLQPQIQAWLNVMGYKNVTINQLKLIFNNMDIPIEIRKEFFSNIESIILNKKSNKILNDPQVNLINNPQLSLDNLSSDVSINNVINNNFNNNNVNLKDKQNNIKKNQNFFMMEFYKRYKRFFSSKGIFWHIKNWQLTINLKKKNIYDINNDLLHKKLTYYLITRKILDSEQLSYFKNNWKVFFQDNLSWNFIIYGLILKNDNNKEKINFILNNYPVEQHHKQFIKFLLRQDFKCSLHTLLTRYKTQIKFHPYSNHEIFILLIKYIFINRKNSNISDKEWIDLFKILDKYYEIVLNDFNGVGISLFFKSVKILLQKQIYKGAILPNNIYLKNFINYINHHQNLIIKWCQEEIYNPYFNYSNDFILDNLQLYLSISKKNYSKKKGYIIEFFSVLLMFNCIH
jgi:hypothetical protein